MFSAANVIAFVGTTDPDRAKPFYSEVLGLDLVEEEQGALVYDSNGTMLRVSIIDQFTPPPFTVLGWEVADIGAGIKELAARGVRFERYEMLDQDELGVQTFPDGTKVAWFEDPDGNVLSLTEFDEG